MEVLAPEYLDAQHASAVMTVKLLQAQTTARRTAARRDVSSWPRWLPCLTQQHCSRHVSGITPFAGGYRPTFFSVDPTRQKIQDPKTSKTRRAQIADDASEDNDASNGIHSGSLPCAVDRGALRGDVQGWW